VVDPLQRKCDRCSQETDEKYFQFFEVDTQNRSREFGVFCLQCSLELVEEMSGKLEWFQTKTGWKGYINPDARSELEMTGFLQGDHSAQCIVIVQIGPEQGRNQMRNLMEILRVEYATGLISKETYHSLKRGD
jgi:hypothetical protein